MPAGCQVVFGHVCSLSFPTCVASLSDPCLQPYACPFHFLRFPSVAHAAMFHACSMRFTNVASSSICFPQSSSSFPSFAHAHVPHIFNQLSIHCHGSSIFRVTSISFPSFSRTISIHFPYSSHLQSTNFHISLQLPHVPSPASPASLAAYAPVRHGCG